MTLLTYALAAFGFGLIFGLLFRVFHRPRRVDYIPLGESKYVEIDGIKIHFVQKGMGPPLVLVHGLASSIWCWAEVLNKFARDYFVTAVDLPGFGISDKPRDIPYNLDAQAKRLGQILEALQIKRANILACSMGGAVALWLTKTRPDLVEKVAVISPATNPSLVPVQPRYLSWLMHICKRFIVTPFLVRQICRLAFAKHNKITHTQLLQYYLPYHRSPDAVVAFWRSIDLLMDPRLPHELDGISRPTLILYGQKDRVIPEKNIVTLNKFIPHAQVVLHPDGGHHLMTDEPQFVVEKVKNFLSQRPLTVVE